MRRFASSADYFIYNAKFDNWQFHSRATIWTLARQYSFFQKATYLKESHGDVRLGKDQKYHSQERTKASVPYRWSYITKSNPGSFWE